MWKISVGFFINMFGWQFKARQGKYKKNNVGHTKFQPTLIIQNNVVLSKTNKIGDTKYKI